MVCFFLSSNRHWPTFLKTNTVSGYHHSLTQTGFPGWFKGSAVLFNCASGQFRTQSEFYGRDFQRRTQRNLDVFSKCMIFVFFFFCPRIVKPFFGEFFCLGMNGMLSLCKSIASVLDFYNQMRVHVLHHRAKFLCLSWSEAGWCFCFSSSRKRWKLTSADPPRDVQINRVLRNIWCYPFFLIL